MVFANCMTVIAFTVRGTQYGYIAAPRSTHLVCGELLQLAACNTVRARPYQYQVWDTWNGIYAHERGHSWKINAQLKA